MLSKCKYNGWNGNVLGNKAHCNCDMGHFTRVGVQANYAYIEKQTA